MIAKNVKTVFMVVHRPSLVEFGEDKFFAVMLHAGVKIRGEAKDRLEWSNTYWAFRSYGLDACVMVGDIPDDVNTADVHMELKALLGDNLEPIIVMKTWETN